MIVSQNKKKIRCSSDVADILKTILSKEDKFDQDKEHFWVIGLNGTNVISYIDLVTLGINNRSLVHPREVFRHAITKGVNAVIIAHNHPSGELNPSQDDISITVQLKDAGEIIGIKLLDHVIVGNGFYSFLEQHTIL